VEGQKIEAQVAKAQAEAIGKVDRVRNAQAKQLKALEEQASDNEYRASLIELNNQEVDAAILVLQSLLSQGLIPVPSPGP
jgi:hypothetical protein